MVYYVKWSIEGLRNFQRNLYQVSSLQCMRIILFSTYWNHSKSGIWRTWVNLLTVIVGMWITKISIKAALIDHNMKSKCPLLYTSYTKKETISSARAWEVWNGCVNKGHSLKKSLIKKFLLSSQTALTGTYV